MSPAQREAKRRYKQRHPERIREQARKYAESNKEKRQKWSREWEAANKDYRKAYRDRNRDAINENSRRSKARNMDKVLARNRVYSHRARKATAWADRSLMSDIYLLAKIYREAGFPCHVDHVVPLHGKLVSGLHTDANLHVLPAGDNIRKRNRWVIE